MDGPTRREASIVSGGRRQDRLEEISPHTLDCPADIAIVERLARRIDPAPARLQNLNDTADHTPVVDALLARVSVGR